PHRDRSAGPEAGSRRQPLHRLPDPGGPRGPRRSRPRPPGIRPGVPPAFRQPARSPDVLEVRGRGLALDERSRAPGAADRAPPRLQPGPDSLRDLGALRPVPEEGAPAVELTLSRSTALVAVGLSCNSLRESG